MKVVRTRFSPSPTGMIHLGNARAALFGGLFAAQSAGTFILRIEDTDMVRSETQYAEALQADLQWLGIHWQEGPGVDGPYGPYWQSKRHAIYTNYYHALEIKKLIYPCYCSDQELALTRKLQLSRSQAPRYAGTCLSLSAEDIAARTAKGLKPAWRFKVATHGTSIEFIDLVKGPQQFKTADVGDFIIRRADGTAPFLFCNAIDDATMHISHVLRGEDHLANTPRQIMILQALGLPIPHYGHLSMITGDDGAPLSKRNGSVSVDEMRQKGYLPIAIINYLARLGHICDSQALLDFDHLALHFHLEKLSRSPARFDKTQLMYWQKIAVQSLDDKALWCWIGPQIEEQVPEDKQNIFIKTVRGNIEFPIDALVWAKIFFEDPVTIDEEGLHILREAGEQFFVEAEQAVERYGTDFSSLLTEMKKSLQLNGKKLFMPLRIALTGKTDGPQLAPIAELLGTDKLRQRFGHAFKLASGRG